MIPTSLSFENSRAENSYSCAGRPRSARRALTGFRIPSSASLRRKLRLSSGRPQIAQREALRQQLESDRRVLELVAQPLHGVGEDVLVVKGERGMLGNGPPSRRARIGAGGERRPVGGDERVVGDGHDTAARVAQW